MGNATYIQTSKVPSREALVFIFNCVTESELGDEFEFLLLFLFRMNVRAQFCRCYAFIHERFTLISPRYPVNLNRSKYYIFSVTEANCLKQQQKELAAAVLKINC